MPIDEQGEENLLVLLVQSGDMAAFEKLLIRIHRPLRSYIARMVSQSTAEDILQETSLQIYRQIRYLREPNAFQAWVYRIATRIALLHLKREKRWRQIETDFDAIQSISATGPSEQQVFENELLRMVDRVSPSSRAVLLLHYQQQFSLEETAAILAIPLGTAKSRLSYGVAKLRAFIKEEGKNERSQTKSVFS